MLHLSPLTGEIFIHELDPSMTFKYSMSIQITKDVHQIQIIDNLIVVHNIEQKSTNFYDVKLAEYNQPCCVDNLDVETKFCEDYYHSDQIFNEELATGDDDGDIKNDTFLSPTDVSEGRQEQPKQSKDYLEVNFQFNYTGEDESPIKVGLDLGETQEKKDSKPAKKV